MIDAGISLGVGILTWCGSERRSDRYGTVWLMNDGHTSLSRGDPEHLLNFAAMVKLEGKRGRLVARVLSPRTSTHIGDLFRGFFPETPDQGEEIELGSGTAFIDMQTFGAAFGVLPDDGRATDWMNPQSLYRAHEQLVDLRFAPIAEQNKPET